MEEVELNRDLRDDNATNLEMRPSGTEGQMSPDIQTAYVSPRDALERDLVSIWEKVLDVQPIGVKDDFFELGDSLQAVSLFGEIYQKLGEDLPTETLLEAPTVEQLAAVLRQET